jgi:hypothetical protein
MSQTNQSLLMVCVACAVEMVISQKTKTIKKIRKREYMREYMRTYKKKC